MRFRSGSRHGAREGCGGTHGNEHGYAVIEMAIVMPAFLLLLFGIFEFSIALTGYLGACYAVRTAARYGGLHSVTSVDPVSVSTLQSMVLAGPFVPSGSSTTVNVSYLTYQGASSGNMVGNLLNLQVSYPQKISLPGYTANFNMGTSCYRMILH